MKKIGGINMNTAVCLKGNINKTNTKERKCTIYESLKQSLKEVKLHKEGKISLKTWDELYEELKRNEE